MKKFKKISKKQFLNIMESSSVILVRGGYTRMTLDDDELENLIIDSCEDIDVDNEEQTSCTISSSILTRHYSNGEVSKLYLNEGHKSYYEYGNILVCETDYKQEKRNYIVYLCV